MAQNYQLVIRAEGEVRDKDGNLISEGVPAEGQTILTEEQAQQLLQAMAIHQQRMQPVIGEEQE